ncbi:hypothetical protein ACHAXR_009105 [Thalassiosira sp. AJA248-18]
MGVHYSTISPRRAFQCWDNSTLGISNSALFEEAGDAILGLDFSSSFKPRAYATHKNVGLSNAQDCADTVWAYAIAGVSHPQLFKEISERVVEIGSTRPLKPQQLSDITWAYSTAGQSQPKI